MNTPQRNARVTVVGSGPNGLAAAVIMARAGHPVRVFERDNLAGGGLQTVPFAEERGVLDVCSAVHPMAVSSRFFREFGLAERIEFTYPEISYAHALDGESAVAYRDLDRTVAELGADGAGWSHAMRGLVSRIDAVRAMSGLTPALSASQAFGAAALALTAALRIPALKGRARALASGAVAHGAAPMSSLAGRFVGSVLAAEAHAAGWPIPVGGSTSITAALLADLADHGGTVITGQEVTDVRDVWEPGDILFFDTAPISAARLTDGLFPDRFARALARYRYGNAASKVDFVLREPIPWSDTRLFGAGTVHLGGPAAEVSQAEAAAHRGRLSEAPFVLLSQPTRFDRTRLPAGSGREIVWSYAHVPNGSPVDATKVISRRIERFAPGFRDVVEHSEARPALWYADHNANFVGGDVLGGSVELRQFLTRPTLSLTPWRTPVPGMYLCSAATPPGAGVHGMGGWHAARLALHDTGRRSLPDLAPTTPKATA